MEAAGELSQLLEAGIEFTARLLQQRGSCRWIGLEPSLREPEEQRRRHEPLLGAIVEVALESPTLLVARADDPRAGPLPRSLRACALETASETRSQRRQAEPRPSAAAGQGCQSRRNPRRPATMIGAETVDR